MSKSEVISMIQQYILDMSNNKRVYVSKAAFAQHSYSIWAANELINYICDHNNMMPLTATEQFINKMDRYSCMSEHGSFMFSVAKDTATDIYDNLITLVERKYYEKNKVSKTFENHRKFRCKK